MNSVELVRKICKDRKIAISKLERDLGYSNGYIGQLRKGVFPANRLAEIASYLNVTIEYLMTGEEPERLAASSLTAKDERDIEKILEATKNQLLTQEGLMFDGEPASQESIDSILAAMKIGMEMAKQKNKEKYTPKKYRKD